MSELWGYYCQDCEKASADEWYNRGEKTILRQYWTLRRLIKSSGQAFDRLTIALTSSEDIGVRMNRFFEDHWSHNVLLRNEYGDFEPMISKEKAAKGLTFCVDCEYFSHDQGPGGDLDNTWSLKCTAIQLPQKVDPVTKTMRYYDPQRRGVFTRYAACAIVNDGNCSLFEPAAEAEAEAA